VVGALYVAENVPDDEVVPVIEQVLVVQLPPTNVPSPAFTANITEAPVTATPAWSRTVAETSLELPSTVAEGAATTTRMNSVVGRRML
jgi:hypothetical protein